VHRSLTLAGALAMAIAYAANRLGVPIADAVAAETAAAVIDLLFNVGLVAVGVGRARARQPLR
jgi:hypothetical protein